MEHDSHEPLPPSPDHTSALPSAITRHDGWTGEKMATFCEVLAETAVVAEACEQAAMGVSGAYARRRRDPFFAAAWDASLTIARDRLADTLLARSMEGNVEQIYRGGELVGERHLLDNRLGLAILRRLDRIAETGLTVSTRGERLPLSPPGARRGPPAVLAAAHAFDWEMMVDALRTGDPEAIAQALALLEGDKVEEVEDPPISLSQDGSRIEDKGLDLTDRCWKDGVDDIWLTDFPPPAGFTGYQSRPYDDERDGERYERECTADEIAALDADAAATFAADRAEDEQLRDAWFAMLAGEGEEDDADPAPASDPDPDPTFHAELDSASIAEPRADAGETPADPDPGRDLAPDPDSAPDPG